MLLANASRARDLLTHRLASAGLAPNTAKQDHLPGASGTGAHNNLWYNFHTPELLPGNIARQVRYLGAQLLFHGATSAEVDNRMFAAKRGWTTLGRFRYSGAQPAQLLMVFYAVVYATLLCGLEAWILAPHHYSQLLALNTLYGRKLMRGTAAPWTHDEQGNKVYRALSNGNVWEWIRFAKPHTELRVRRLKWYQTLARSPFLHRVILVVWCSDFLGDQPHAQDGRVTSTANDWAKQFQQDVLSADQFDDGHDFVHALDGKALRVFTVPFINEWFQRLDFTAFKRAGITTAIPPPGYVHPDRDSHVPLVQ